MLAYLRQTQADLFIVLGGLGRSNAQATDAARALSSLQRLVLVVRGGSDGFDPDLPLPPNVLDASALRSLRIGSDNLLLWPGSEQGRYVEGSAGCGFAASELQTAQDELGSPSAGERRWLLSWQAPAPGSPLAAFVARVGVAGVFYAWPPSEGDPDPTRPQQIPRAWGPRLEASDGHPLELGSRVLTFDREGLHEAG